MSITIKRHDPDVVVGSSWGGAVALACIQTGVWYGPTLLLAPAHQRIEAAMGASFIKGGVKVRREEEEEEEGQRHYYYYYYYYYYCCYYYYYYDDDDDYYYHYYDDDDY